MMALLMGHYLIGKRSHKLELGTGVLLGDVDHVEWKFPHPPGATFTIGYRYLPESKGKLTFRAGFTPLISNGKFHPRFGISLGGMLWGPGN
jgi:hypothetical protein